MYLFLFVWQIYVWISCSSTSYSVSWFSLYAWVTSLAYFQTTKAGSSDCAAENPWNARCWAWAGWHPTSRVSWKFWFVTFYNTSHSSSCYCNTVSTCPSVVVCCKRTGTFSLSTLLQQTNILQILSLDFFSVLRNYSTITSTVHRHFSREDWYLQHLAIGFSSCNFWLYWLATLGIWTALLPRNWIQKSKDLLWIYFHLYSQYPGWV